MAKKVKEKEEIKGKFKLSKGVGKIILYNNEGMTRKVEQENQTEEVT